MPFLTGNEEFETRMKKSVCSRYSAVLLNTMFHHSDNVMYVEKFGTQLLTIPKKGKLKLYCASLDFIIGRLKKNFQRA